MKDGSYWVYDKNRYGYEVVRVIGDKFYRFGIELGFSVDAFSVNYEFTKIEAPKAI